MHNRSGLASLLLAAFILGTFGVWIRILDQSFTNTAQVVMRSGFAALIITGIVLWKRISFKIERRHWKYLVGFSLVFPLSLIAFTYSATQLKVSNALFMLYVGSLIATYAWGRIAFGEKLTATKVASIILLLAGLVLFVYPFSIDKLSIAVILGILAGVLEGSAHAFRKFLKDIPREVVVFFQSASSVIIALILFVASGQNFTKDFQPVSLLVAALFGALLVSIGYLLFYGFNHYDVNLGAIVLATELFFAIIINFIFLSEAPTTFEFIGGIFIFAGAAVTSIDSSTLSKIKLRLAPSK
jgi:drug/metabolite transporter (DMT)-like permease